MNVRFGRDEILAGTLTLPSTPAPHPAAVLIHGGNADDRDCGHVGFPAFRLFAESLREHGIASLRYDDRGVGESGGGAKWDGTIEDIASDIAAAVKMLRQRPELNSNRIGLIGWSLGGVIAPLVAALGHPVAWIVTMAGHAVPTMDLFLAFRRYLAAQSKNCPDKLEAALDLDRSLFAAIMKAQPTAQLTAQLRTRAETAFADQSAKDREQLGSFDDYFATTWDGALADLAATRLLRSILNHDPLPALEKVRCPVLSLFAEDDEMVSPPDNAKLFAEGFAKAGNPDHTIEIIPEINHMLTRARVSTSELAPIVLEKVCTWITARL